MHLLTYLVHSTFILVLLLQLPGPPGPPPIDYVLKSLHWLKVQERIEYNVSLFPASISSTSLLHATCVIS